MPRVMRCANHCSPVELYLLKSLRMFACSDSEQDEARLMLRKMGIDQYQAFFFCLVKWVLRDHPQFDFHKPESAFISTDELSLLASLAQASRKSIRESTQSKNLHMPILQQSIDDCGKVLLENNILLKFRPMLKESIRL